MDNINSCEVGFLEGNEKFPEIYEVIKLKNVYNLSQGKFGVIYKNFFSKKGNFYHILKPLWRKELAKKGLHYSFSFKYIVSQRNSIYY